MARLNPVDLFDVRSALTEEERMVQDSVARLVDEEKTPLSLVEKETSFRFYVEDNGPGVPEEIRVTLFEPFVSKGKQGGTGLGLTLADRIAREHGGAVELESSEPGRTVFCLSLDKATMLSFEAASQEQPLHVPQAPQS